MSVSNCSISVKYDQIIEQLFKLLNLSSKSELSRPIVKITADFLTDLLGKDVTVMDPLDRHLLIKQKLTQLRIRPPSREGSLIKKYGIFIGMIFENFWGLF